MKSSQYRSNRSSWFCLLSVFLLALPSLTSSAQSRLISFESIRGLGSCRDILAVRAEHQDINGVTVWLKVAPSKNLAERVGSCALRVADVESRFESYSFSSPSFATPQRATRQTRSKSSNLVVPVTILNRGGTFLLRLLYRTSQDQLRSPLIAAPRNNESCSTHISQVRAAEISLRSCTSDADCSSEGIPFGCGCQYEKPIRLGASLDAFYAAIGTAAKMGCSIDEVSACDCLPVSEVTCRSGICDWK